MKKILLNTIIPRAIAMALGLTWLDHMGNLSQNKRQCTTTWNT